jgi:hypothetical protein
MGLFEVYVFVLLLTFFFFHSASAVAHRAILAKWLVVVVHVRYCRYTALKRTVPVECDVECSENRRSRSGTNGLNTNSQRTQGE